MMTTKPSSHTPAPLRQLGWSPFFENQIQDPSRPDLSPARVIGVSKNSFRTSNGNDQTLATLSGTLARDPDGVRPVTGDWVLMTDTVIFRVLERQNALSRGASGSRSQQDDRPMRGQVIAANLDRVFIVCGLDRDFNLRRIERYLTLVYNCGLTPAIILTKADLHPDPAAFAREVESVAFGVPVHLISALDPDCLSPLVPYLGPGKTATLIGSSGAGKSTLVNRLSRSEIQSTGAISSRLGKGRHTTTSRDLIMMPQGGMIIDNPGIREIAFWETDEGAASAFPDIDARAADCRFSDCSHEHEPGCRVIAAVESGEIPRQRLENFRKMKREMAYLSQRRDKSADRVEKERWKGVALKIKAMNRQRR